MDTASQRYLEAIENRPRTVEAAMAVYHVDDPEVAADLLERQERFVRWLLAHPGEPLTDRGMAEDLLLLGSFRTK
ncbi:MAG: hypothetical protein ACOYZ7_01505 [Chloroflexota bacterium]